MIEDDADDDGVAELAVLSTRDSDGRGVVGVENAIGPVNTRTFWSPPGYVPMDMAVVPDTDDDGVPDIAVFSTRDSDGRILVQVRNADGSGIPYPIWFAQGHTAIDVAALPHKDVDGIPEVAVLSFRDSDGRVLDQRRRARRCPDSSFGIGNPDGRGATH